MMQTYRKGSRLAVMQRAYQDSGAEAAVKAGKEAGLSDSSIAGALSLWRRQEGEGSSTEAPSTTSPKDRVSLTYWPERVGTIVREGPEISEVKFDDNHQTNYIANRFLLPKVSRQARDGSGS